jgi:hypothetical protein
MGQRFFSTLEVAKELGLTRQYVLRRAQEANLDLAMVGPKTKAWTPENVRLVSEICRKPDCTTATGNRQR